ncbi:MAG: YceI family protein [Bacteroidota bacterium]
MKTRILIISMLVPFMLLGHSVSVVKTFKVDKAKTTVTVSGTSNLHDWESKVTNFDGNLEAVIGPNNLIDQINTLTVNFYSNSFRSGKDGMDEKTFTALKTDKFSAISFKLLEIKEKKMVSKVQQLVASGNLTISGVTKKIDLTVLSFVGTNGEVYFQGNKQIDMTEYGITPPEALFGTVKAGKLVTANFKMYFQ